MEWGEISGPEMMRTSFRFTKNLISYHFSRTLGRNLLSTPLAAYVRISKECNMKCSYCYLEKDTNTQNKFNLCSVVDQIHSMGIKFIGLSGGEPLLRMDLINQIIPRIKNYGIKGIIFTNGSLLPEIELGPMIEAGFKGWCISIDGRKRINDSLRTEGAYSKAIEALEILKRYGDVTLHIDITLTRKNLEDIDHLIDLGKRFGAILWFQPLFRKTDRTNNKEYDGLIPLQKDKETIQEIVQRLIHEKMENADLIGNPTEGLKEIGKYYNVGYSRLNCLAAVRNLHIDHEGNVRPCWFMPPVGNINEIPLRRIYTSAEYFRSVQRMRECDESCLCNSHFVPGPLLGSVRDLFWYPVRRRFN